MKCDELITYTGPTYGSAYYDIDEVDAAIAELKDKIKIYEDLGSCKKGCPALRHNQRRVESEIYKVELKDKEIKELKQKLEDVQASAYAESVDAGMRERRLRRALWLARADRAKEKAFNWRFRNPNNNNCLYGINYLVEYDERKIRRTNNEWFEVFSEVERKCRAKAESYL